VNSDLDLPILPSAEQIRRREFATVRRGYNPDQVRDYLGQVADQVATMERDLRSRKGSTATPSSLAGGPMTPGEHLAAQVAAEESRRSKDPRERQPFGDPYADLGKRFASMIEAADAEATKVVDEAKQEANRILEQARSEADRIRVDAQARAEEARQEASVALVRAREEADRILGGLSGRRETLVKQMQDMQTRLLDVAQELETAMADRDETIEKAVAARTEHPSSSPREQPSSSREQPQPKRAPEPVDPRYEDLWVSKSDATPGPVDIPDLEPIDLDFGEDPKRD
jgi:cell division initiation protein